MSEVVAATGGLGNVEAIVLDLDGVVYVGSEAVPGAGEALSALALTHQVLFATNNATKTASTVAQLIAASTGYPAVEGQVATSARATVTAMAGHVTTAYVVGERGLVQTVESGGIVVTDEWRDADGVVVGLDRAFDYRTLSDASNAVRRGAAFYVTNEDATFPIAGGFEPGGGSIAAAIATAGGRAPIVCGKPHRPMRDLIESLLLSGATGDSVLVVGDRPETDIALAKVAGWSSVLVLTGVVSSVDEVADRFRPDRVIPSIAELPALLGVQT